MSLNCKRSMMISMRYFWLLLFTLSGISFGNPNCPFSKLSTERRTAIEVFAQSTREAQIKLFAGAKPDLQKDYIDTLALSRAGYVGTFTETLFLDQIYALANHPKADRISTRQALRHLIYVFHSRVDPVWYDDFQVSDEMTGSGFRSGQSNMEYSRKLAIDYSAQLAAKGLGGEYEDTLLLNGLKECQIGSEGRPAGRGMELAAAKEGLTLLSMSSSQFPSHLKPAAARLIHQTRQPDPLR